MVLIRNSRTGNEVTFRLKISRTSNVRLVAGEAAAVVLRAGSKEVVGGEVDLVVAAAVDSEDVVDSTGHCREIRESRC